MPLPAELEYSFTASQLISATWQDDTQQLPVQVEVTPDKVVLAGFSSWGTRILSLQYQNQAIETQVLSGLGATLPQPEQVLFNLMLTPYGQQKHGPNLCKALVGIWSIQKTAAPYLMKTNRQSLKLITKQSPEHTKPRAILFSSI